MFATVKLVLAGGAIASLSMLSFTSAAVQDPAPVAQADPVHQETVWNFAVLQYTSDTDQTVEIAASTIEKIWLLSMGHGRLRMEILFQNRDYSMIDLRSFNIIRRSNTFSAVDVPIVRTNEEGMVFPAFK